MKSIPESDWKILRAIKDESLNIACERIFAKIQDIIEVREGKEHKAYLRLWKLIEEEDRKISVMFDDLRLSTAIHKLAVWRRNGVISDEYFLRFSNDTQQVVRDLNQ
jgi:hypothetical protein